MHGAPRCSVQHLNAAAAGNVRAAGAGAHARMRMGAGTHCTHTCMRARRGWAPGHARTCCIRVIVVVPDGDLVFSIRGDVDFVGEQAVLAAVRDVKVVAASPREQAKNTGGAQLRCRRGESRPGCTAAAQASPPRTVPRQPRPATLWVLAARPLTQCRCSRPRPCSSSSLPWRPPPRLQRPPATRAASKQPRGVIWTRRPCS